MSRKFIKILIDDDVLKFKNNCKSHNQGFIDYLCPESTNLVINIINNELDGRSMNKNNIDGKYPGHIRPEVKYIFPIEPEHNLWKNVIP